MSSLGTTIKEIQNNIRTIAGIKQAPPYPDEKGGQWPAVVCFPFSGKHIQNTTEDVRALHDIILQFHYPRTDLKTAVEQSVIYAESIPNAIFSMLQNGGFSVADTFSEITYRFVGDDWASEETVGFEFTIREVKIRTVIT